MSKEISFSAVTQQRISKWIESTKSVNEVSTWTEIRQAIVIGEHTYILSNGQVFQCGHCGRFDPEWSVTEVIAFFKATFNVDPIEIEVTCSVAIPSVN
jgi:hypothetical protein